MATNPEKGAFTGAFARLYALGSGRLSMLRRLYVKVANEIASACPLATILDVGAGPGTLLLEVMRRCPIAKVVGVDLSQDMARIAAERAAREGVSHRAWFAVADAAELPFVEGSFDLVVSTASLHHWARPVDSLLESYRVLARGGEVWIYDLRRDFSREDRATLRREVGPLMAFAAATMAKYHSSVSRERVEELIATAQVPERNWTMEDRGLFLKLRLWK